MNNKYAVFNNIFLSGIEFKIMSAFFTIVDDNFIFLEEKDKISCKFLVSAH